MTLIQLGVILGLALQVLRLREQKTPPRPKIIHRVPDPTSKALIADGVYLGTEVDLAVLDEFNFEPITEITTTLRKTGASKVILPFTETACLNALKRTLKK